MPAKGRTRKPDYKKKIWMREHYVRQGLTMTEVGVLAGVSAMTIRSQLIKMGIPTRSRGARHPLNPKWKTSTVDPETTNLRRCSNCGKSGHNSRTCGKELASDESPAEGFVTISTEPDTDPAIKHLLALRDKLRADLVNVEQALSLVEMV